MPALVIASIAFAAVCNGSGAAAAFLLLIAFCFYCIEG